VAKRKKGEGDGLRRDLGVLVRRPRDRDGS
jgi:hypothetical protein